MLFLNPVAHTAHTRTPGHTRITKITTVQLIFQPPELLMGAVFMIEYMLMEAVQSKVINDYCK